MFRGLFASFKYKLCSATSWIIRSSSAGRDKISLFSKTTDLPEAHPYSYSVGGDFLLGGKAAGT